MRDIPVSVILSWPLPNYEHPETRGDGLLVTNAICIALVTITIGLRLYTRVFIKRWFGADDVFIVLAFIFTVALTACVLLANQNYGWNHHIYDIPIEKLAPNAKIAMAAKLLFTAAATFTRLSLLSFYYRLVADSGKRWFFWAVHANVAFTIAIFITFICLIVFLCTPVSAYWTIAAPSGSCLDEGYVTLAAGIINCIADLLITILPIPLVMRLQMPLGQRLAVSVLFSLGLIVTVAGVVRTWYIYKGLVAEYDMTWYTYPLWIASTVEIDLGVICASAPVLRPLMSEIPGFLSTIPRSSAQTPDFSSHGGTLSASTAHKSINKLKKSRKEGPTPPVSRGQNQKDEQAERDHEMSQWNDVELGNNRCSSADAILSDYDLVHFDFETNSGSTRDIEYDPDMYRYLR